MNKTRMTEADAQKRYTHERPEPDTLPPTSRVVKQDTICGPLTGVVHTGPGGIRSSGQGLEPEAKELMTLIEDESVKLPSIVNIRGLGEIIATSGLFKDAKQAAKAIVKVLAGQELGFAPMFSMSNIHVIEGRISMGAQIIAAKIRGSGEYDYKILDLSPTGCKLSIANVTTGECMGQASFVKADAARAKLLNKNNWQKYPQDIYFARAMGRLARYHVPHLFGGAVYTPEELGAMIGDDGTAIIEGESEDITDKAVPAMNLKGSDAENAESKLRIEAAPETENEKISRVAVTMIHVLELYADGKPIDKIAKITKVPIPLIKSWIDSSNVNIDAVQAA